MLTTEARQPAFSSLCHGIVREPPRIARWSGGYPIIDLRNTAPDRDDRSLGTMNAQEMGWNCPPCPTTPIILLSSPDLSTPCPLPPYAINSCSLGNASSRFERPPVVLVASHRAIKSPLNQQKGETRRSRLQRDLRDAGAIARGPAACR